MKKKMILIIIFIVTFVLFSLNSKALGIGFNNNDDFIRIGSITTSSSTEIDPRWSANFTNMQVDASSGNCVYGFYGNGSVKLRACSAGAASNQSAIDLTDSYYKFWTNQTGSLMLYIYNQSNYSSIELTNTYGSYWNNFSVNFSAQELTNAYLKLWVNQTGSLMFYIYNETNFSNIVLTNVYGKYWNNFSVNYSSKELSQSYSLWWIDQNSSYDKYNQTLTCVNVMANNILMINQNYSLANGTVLNMTQSTGKQLQLNSGDRAITLPFLANYFGIIFGIDIQSTTGMGFNYTAGDVEFRRSGNKQFALGIGATHEGLFYNEPHSISNGASCDKGWHGTNTTGALCNCIGTATSTSGTWICTQ